MKTVAILNRKGGVGKSSTCFHVSGALGAKGLRVLLLDLDPQTNLTQGLLGPDAVRRMPPDRTLAALLDDHGGPALPDLIIPTPVPGVALLPGSEAAERLNVTEPEHTGSIQYALRDALDDVRGRFDIVLADCPPNVQLCSWSALVAADAVLVPVPPEDFGALGLVSLTRAIRRVQAGPNPSLRLLGYLVTMFDKRLAVHTSYEADLRAVHGDAVFRTVVPLAKDFKEAVLARKPVGLFRPKSAAAKVVVALSDEMTDRLRGAASGTEGEAA